MPKINQEEYEVLKELDDKYKWIARDEDRGLYAFTKKPVKKDGPSSYWWDADPYSALGLIDEIHLFQFIQWEDEEPYSIDELIEEYEYSADHVSHVVNERVKALGNAWKESEETEVKKDIEWLKNQVDKLETTINYLLDGATTHSTRISLSGSLATLRDFRGYINQLDEPEVLSSDWIKDNQLMWTSIHGAEYYVPANKLYGKIVPKQEITEEQAWEIIHGKYGDEVLQNNIDYVESQGYVVIEKPTVPQFVADWHVQNKYYLLGAKFERIADSEDKRVVDWYRQCSGRHNNKLSNAQETIALMDLVGYEVEEEPQYRLKAGENYLYFNLDGTVRGATKDNATITKERLEQLPFDVEKAVESGIIEVEELEE